MTLKGDGWLARGLKNDIRNLVNFHASNQKSENLHFDGLLLCNAYKDLDENVQKSYVLWHWRMMQSLKKNWLLFPKMTYSFVNFNGGSDKSENFHFDVLLLSIAYKVLAKKVQNNYLYWHWRVNFEEKLTFCLKNDMRNLVSFNTSSWKS